MGQRIAAIDYGTVRLGIAVADTEVRIASPYANYTRRGPAGDAKYLRSLVRDEQIKLVVVGLPVHLNGDESQKSYEARQFAAWLTAETGVPVEFFDERFTSAQAEEILLAAELTSKQRKARRDQLAAQILLTSYLEAGSRGNDNPGSIG